MLRAVTAEPFHYQELAPPPDLAAVVECFWFASGPGGGVEHIVPDGCPELVVQLGASMRAGDEGGPFSAQPRALVVGSRERPLQVSPTDAFATVGARIRPGGLGRLAGTSARELSDGWVSLEALFGRAGQQLVAALEAAPHLEARAAELTRFVRSMLERRRAPDARLAAAVQRLRERRGQDSLHRLRLELGVSERWLERSFAREVGLAPRTLASLLRLHGALQAVGPGASWADVALAAGYFDQAHLNRDFRRYAGLPPSELLRVLGPLARRFVAPERLATLLGPAA
jgi:methylphosphotriester-DNA--protein-cysteine methyltransferase